MLERREIKIEAYRQRKKLTFARKCCTGFKISLYQSHSNILLNGCQINHSLIDIFSGFLSTERWLAHCYELYNIAEEKKLIIKLWFQLSTLVYDMRKNSFCRLAGIIIKYIYNIPTLLPLNLFIVHDNIFKMAFGFNKSLV